MSKKQLKVKKKIDNNNLCIDHTSIREKISHTKREFMEKKFTHKYADKGDLDVSLGVPSPLPLASLASWGQNSPHCNVANT